MCVYVCIMTVCVWGRVKVRWYTVIVCFCQKKKSPKCHFVKHLSFFFFFSFCRFLLLIME